MRALVAAAALLVMAAAPTHAESWAGRDVRRDVRAFDLDPAAEPCAEVTERRVPDDETRDITGLAVDHDPDTVTLRLALRRVAGSADTVYTLHLRVPRGAFFVSVSRDERGGPLTTFFAREPRPPDPAEIESCSYTQLDLGRPCRGLSAARPSGEHLVEVSVPRSCLARPRWVQVGADVTGFGKTRADGRFRVFHDAWAPRGVSADGFLPPYGPRVRVG